MRSFKVTAQSYTSSQRVTKAVYAENEIGVMLAVSEELECVGFYIVDIKLALRAI